VNHNTTEIIIFECKEATRTGIKEDNEFHGEKSIDKKLNFHFIYYAYADVLHNTCRQIFQKSA
jgi:hypothetical protein